MKTFNQFGADRLAYECALLVKNGNIDSRSPMADALLDYMGIGMPGEPQDVPAWIKQFEESGNSSKNSETADHPNTVQQRDLPGLYYTLLLAVDRKFPGESRHETALRYIREAEDRACAGELFKAIDDHVKRGGRIVFWTCPNRCHDIVDWYYDNTGKSLATCRKCGASNN